MIKFNPPVAELTENQCNAIMRYMVLFYRTQDVEYTVENEDWYMAMSEEEKQKALVEIAKCAEDLIAEHDLHYQDAINEAIERLGYEEEVIE